MNSLLRPTLLSLFRIMVLFTQLPVWLALLVSSKWPRRKSNKSSWTDQRKKFWWARGISKTESHDWRENFVSRLERTFQIFLFRNEEGQVREFIKIFTEWRYVKPFISLNVLFLLMSFSGKFAIEMYAMDILEATKSSIDRRSALISLGWIEALGMATNLACNDCRSSQPCGLPSIPATGETLSKKKYSDNLLSLDGSHTGRLRWVSFQTLLAFTL